MWEIFGVLCIHMFPTVYVRNAKQCSGASERKTQSPPQITDGFRGNTAKFILSYQKTVSQIVRIYFRVKEMMKKTQ